MESSEEGRDDAETFNQLVRRYGPTLARSVRCRIANPSDAEDVLQETLLALWRGFRRLRDPSRMRAWMMQVSENRCRDYFRRQGRRETPLEETALQDHANRFGLHQYRQTNLLTDVTEALEAAPPAAREAARRFYLEGLTIAEIAADSHSPPGTVKRQLFQARHAARTFLGVPHTRTEKITMTTQNAAENPTNFPSVRPEIRITELDEPPFAVDCQELRAWPIIPRVGEQASSADYFLPHWELGEAASMQALRPGKVHNVEGVEIEVRLWKPETGWQRPGTIYARLTDDKAEYLAVHLPHEGQTQIETFLDSSFAWNWGTLDRAISDRGLVRRAPDGSVELSESTPHARDTGTGFGVVRLEVAGRRFTCLRVLDVDENSALAKSDTACVTESYLTRQGRTVLVRRFCRPRFAEVAQFPVILDESDRLIINGVAFAHWYDTLMGIAV